MVSIGMFLHGELTETSKNTVKELKSSQMNKLMVLWLKSLESSSSNLLLRVSSMTA